MLEMGSQGLGGIYSSWWYHFRDCSQRHHKSCAGVVFHMARREQMDRANRSICNFCGCISMYDTLHCISDWRRLWFKSGLWRILVRTFYWDISVLDWYVGWFYIWHVVRTLPI